MIVFSTQWFKKYSKAITFLARFPFVGELIFNFNKFGHYVDRKKIVEVTPNSVVEFVKMKGKKVELKQHFFTRNEYALRLQHVFYPIWITFHIWDIITRPIPQLNLGFDTLTKYPYPVDETANTVDGYSMRTGVDQTFANIRAGAGNATGSGYATQVYLLASATNNQYQRLTRAREGFDTSSLEAGATISDVTLTLKGNKVSYLLGNPSLRVCGITPASNTSLANGDYDNFGSTSFGSKAYADWVNGGTENIITLNDDGKTYINKTGITNLGLRLSWDILNDTTGLTWGSGGADAGFNIYDTSQGVDNCPKLVVTYTVSSGTVNIPTLLTMGVG